MTGELNPAAQEVRQVLRRISDAWVDARYDVLRECFHEAMVIFEPNSGERCRGRDACVQSYEEFAKTAEVVQISEADHAVDVWGDTAVATYSFDITYVMGGEEHQGTGTDVFVLQRGEGGWKAVWRTVIEGS